jgi:mRNA interferase RelE/StbE
LTDRQHSSKSQIIYRFADNPGPQDTKALDGEQTGYYRLRIDLYRVIYIIQEEMVTVIIVRVARRDQERIVTY